MLNAKVHLAIIIGILAASPASGSPLSGTDAANEFSAENSQCSAFYTIGLRCFDRQYTEKDKNDFEKAQHVSNQRVYLMGKQAGLSDAALLARNELAVKQAIKDIDSNCQNISVLLNKYAEFCKKIMEDPATRVNELLTFGK